MSYKVEYGTASSVEEAIKKTREFYRQQFGCSGCEDPVTIEKIAYIQENFKLGNEFHMAFRDSSRSFYDWENNQTRGYIDKELRLRVVEK